MVVAGGHDGVEALYTTEELQVEGDGSFASEWCAPSRSVARTHARTHAQKLTSCTDRSHRVEWEEMVHPR